MKKYNSFVLIIMLTIVFASCTEVPISIALEITSTPTSFNKTPTNSPTLIPISTKTFSPIDNYFNKIRKMSEECSPILDVSLKSSDINWLIYNCRETRELLIISQDGSKAWQIGYDQLSSYPDPNEIRIHHWSEDNRYVYFVPSYCCWDPGIMFLGQPLDEIWQFDLISGIPINIMKGFNYVSFSPNDKTVLIIPQISEPPPVIYVYDLENYKVSQKIFISAFPNNASTGGVVWSPNGEQFAIVTASGGDFERYEQGAELKEPLWSVLVIDLNTFLQKVVISESKNPISLFEITDEGILLLAFYEYKTNKSTIITNAQYDIKSDKLLISTPSP